MSIITIGSDAIDRVSSYGNTSYTAFDTTNPASADCTVYKLEIYCVSGHNATALKIGVFYGSSTSWTYRAGTTIGAVTAGSKQTFTGLSFAAQTGDIVGFYDTSAWIENDNSSGGGHLLQKAGDHCKAEGAQTYADIFNPVKMSLVLEGTTVVNRSVPRIARIMLMS